MLHGTLLRPAEGGDIRSDADVSAYEDEDEEDGWGVLCDGWIGVGGAVMRGVEAGGAVVGGEEGDVGGEGGGEVGVVVEGGEGAFSEDYGGGREGCGGGELGVGGWRGRLRLGRDLDAIELSHGITSSV